MRIAVFSDVHANQEALEAFMDHAGRQKVHQFVCLGDIVGYGASPNRCIALLQRLPAVRFILGNHDSAAMGGVNNMNADAGMAMVWTRRRLTRDNIAFLRQMEVTLQWDHLLFCHANPYHPLAWTYVAQKSAINKSFARTRAKMVFIGHTHSPSAITRKNFLCMYIRSPRASTVVPAALEKRQIFNCGSIGQPRDGDPRASYLIYDTTTCMVEFHRVNYDCQKAARKILDAGLPASLADRLSKGT